MAQIADFTVKNRNAADVTFTALQGASGDSPAIWRVNIAGSPPALCPTFHAWQKQNKDGSVKRIEWKVMVPVGDYTTVVSPQPRKLLSSGVHYIPQDVLSEMTDDMATYVGGILSAAQIVAAFKSGFLPN